ncbi:alkylated DNA repair protein (DNA oxidative demethylase) [Pseudoxanthobacter soli DSM 19599]|uniref:Alkylated DNA repair protein (DNA oxidative demethylase) n=1 Tax=Pseudoxanthobacter soli DSM 19599 TaxID=1123029 RepID=A0A1M7ZD72_9HYPH|nr:alpha-ketoglutarate-dependent dioxygenase AlkB [Pseudoxanthobacter soli]SHO62749.1 alkylated DNA repair protein (DNA oxidative demethylase) [Pseudoxanthobacter soli DSM 19599]
MTALEVGGARYLPGLLDASAQAALVAELQAAIAEAPFFRPRMPRTGKPFSVEMTNCGPLGWVSDETGYRYQPCHPVTGRPWPAIPAPLMDLWKNVAGWPAPPQACLVNLYRAGARMGLHQDRDEADLGAPVLSLSLGDSAVFRIGGTTRGGPTRSVTLASGDAVVLEGASRLAFHGIDRVLAGSSRLIPGGGRINLTLRRVTPSAG